MQWQRLSQAEKDVYKLKAKITSSNNPIHCKNVSSEPTQAEHFSLGPIQQTLGSLQTNSFQALQADHPPFKPFQAEIFSFEPLQAQMFSSEPLRTENCLPEQIQQ